MKKVVLFLFIFGLLVLSGCINYDNSQKGLTDSGYISGFIFEDIRTGTFGLAYSCEDKIVCYYNNQGGSAGGMDCFRDKDLVDKYCGVQN